MKSSHKLSRMIDRKKKLALIGYIRRRQNVGGKEILIPADLYFGGYDDPHCTICANNSQSISTSKFAARLNEIQCRSDVSGVFVRFYDYLDALEFEDAWVGSDTVFVITSAELAQVQDWFSDFEVSNVSEESDCDVFIDPPPMPEGYRIFAIWWD